MGKNEVSSNQKNRKAKAKIYYKNISKREKGKDFGGGGNRWKRGQSGWIPKDQLNSNWDEGRPQGRGRAVFAPGMKGFLCTTNMREGKCVIEAYNILNEYSADIPEVTQKKVIIDNDGGGEDGDRSSTIPPSGQQADTTKNDTDSDQATDELPAPDVALSKEKNDDPAELGNEDDLDDMGEDDMDEDDIDKALSKEIKGLKSYGSTRRFQSVDTGVKNVLFISTTIDDPKSLAEKIYDDIIAKSQAKCRHLLRFIPIAMTCKASFEDIKAALQSILPKYFEGGFKSFKVEYNSRCNSKFDVSRGGIIDIAAKIVTQINPMTFVDLHNPLYTIYIDVVNLIVCVSVLTNYSKYRKYNLVEVAIQRPPVLSGKCESTNEQQTVDKDKVADGDSKSEAEQSACQSTEGDTEEGNEKNVI